ncbi:DHA2 family efflux MFS transporter permease subunit [Roseomonas elaeocarpi]|uniref:DHA2 family efflux MFS transporter permease subunit n=1 Tax=Roseomonas elaeocarpi TaxID=907779 RepID=A0ABV6JVC5_9PROT
MAESGGQNEDRRGAAAVAAGAGTSGGAPDSAATTGGPGEAGAGANAGALTAPAAAAEAPAGADPLTDAVTAPPAPPAGTAAPAARPRWRDDPRFTAAIVASALLMQNLDSSVIATALPAMARDLGSEPLHLSAAITSYLVALTVFVPVSGWVADRYGAKRVFLWAIGVFVASSVACGLATGLFSLVAARVVQGMGGAMMVPVARLLLLRRVSREEIVRATTWLTMPALLGPIMGPPLGGFLTDAVSWRWVFWINLPIGLVGLLLAWTFITSPEQARPPRLDVPGIVLTGVSLALLMFGFETLGRGLVPSPWPLLALLVGVVSGVLAVWHCLRTRHPAIDLSLMRIPAFAVTITAGTLFRCGAGAIPFLVPLAIQLGFGASASVSGSITLASALGAFAMKPLVGPTLRRLGYRGTLLWNTVLQSGLVLLLALLTTAWPLWAVFIVLLLNGTSRSLHFTSLNSLAYSEVPQERLSAATSLYSTAQQLSMALGVVLGSSVLSVSVALHSREEPILGDFSAAFVVVALVLLVSLPLCLRLPSNAGQAVSGHRGGRARTA